MATGLISEEEEMRLTSKDDNERIVAVKRIIDCYTPEDAAADLGDEAYQSLRGELRNRGEVYGNLGKEFLRKLDSIEDWGI